MKMRGLTFLWGLLVSATALQAETLTLQEGTNYSGCDDSYIASQRPSENYSAEEKLGSKYEYCSA